MTDYTAQNCTVFKIGLNNFAEHEIKAKIVAKLRQLAQWVVESVDNNFAFGDSLAPAWTFNLHDSTGVGVYSDGRLTAFMPTAKAITPQTYRNEQVRGSECLNQALNAATATFAKGIWFVVFSAVPYAFQVNTYGSYRGRGMGFFDLFTQDLETAARELLSDLNPIAQ